MDDLKDIAAVLDTAALNRKAVPQLSASGRALSLADAYVVQAHSIARREQRGERVIGVKMGFTSRAKMAQMQINDLIWGRISDAMLLEEGGSASMKQFIHPRVEPELVFLLKHRLSGCVSLAQAEAAIECVAPALEVIDSRYENFKFSLEDVVADNSSSSAVVVGTWCRPTQDLSNLGMVLTFNGRAVQIGSSAAILGHPARSLVAAARLAAASGLSLEPGWLVMAGAATAAQAVRPGVLVSLSVEALGRAQVTFVE